MSRKPYTVVSQLIAVSEDDAFTADLRHLLYSMTYKAPELINEIWGELFIVFNRHIKDRDVPWRDKAVAILQDEKGSEG